MAECTAPKRKRKPPPHVRRLLVNIELPCVASRWLKEHGVDIACTYGAKIAINTLDTPGEYLLVIPFNVKRKAVAR